MNKNLYFFINNENFLGFISQKLFYKIIKKIQNYEPKYNFKT